MRSLLVLCLFVFVNIHSFAQTLSKETVLIETPYGNMKVKLYEETPLHKANFLQLVRQGFYDSTLFHRVINEFMIQGGDSLSKRARPGDSLGHGDRGYMVPAEFNPAIIHKKGRLCAARENDDINPEKASSAAQFYIVMGKKRTEEDLRKYEDRFNKARFNKLRKTYLQSPPGLVKQSQIQDLEKRQRSDSIALINSQIDETVKGEYDRQPPFKFSAYQRETYLNEPGTPHLDGNYTVYGEVIEGMEVIDKIAGVKTDKRDRPLEDVRIRMRVIN